MDAWLLSGHNPRESLGITYPITTSWFTEFANRQLEYVVGPLAGGTERLDLSLPTMTAVNSQAFINISCLNRNIATILPFDTAAFGVPKDALPAAPSPPLSTQLLLPLRLRRVYREAMRTYDRVIPAYRSMLRELFWYMHGLNSGELTAQDLAQIGRLFDQQVLEQTVAYSNLIMFIGMLNTGVVGLVAEKAPSLLNLLVGQGTATAQLGQRMWELCEIATRCGSEVVNLLRLGETNLGRYEAVPSAAPLVQAVRKFIHTYGHRAFRYASELEATRLADQPELVLLTVAGLLDESEPPSVRAESARQVSLQALQDMGAPQRLLWKMLIRWGSSLVERREEIRDILELQSATYGLAARQLSRHHFPDSPEHLLFYTFDEFLAFGQSRGKKRVDPAVVELRREEFARHRSAPALPELIWYNPSTKEWWPAQESRQEQTSKPEECLRGIAASAGSGVVEGVALVTNDAQEAVERLLHMTGPVILVTHVTDPVWSSIFRRLTAVVTEMGGVISHAAIVARESGIPAVVGVAQAVHRIRDGEWVRVDGSAGTVEFVSHKPEG